MKPTKSMLTLLAAAAAAAVSVGVAPAAHADPPCAAFDTCQYMPNPYNGGPSMPTWDVPGTYGGWTDLPVQCDPVAYTCRQVVPGP